MLQKPENYGNEWVHISRRVESIEPPSLEAHFSYPTGGPRSSPSTTVDLSMSPQHQVRCPQMLQGEDQFFSRIHCLHAFEVPCDTGKNPPSMIGWRHSRNPVMHAAGQGDIVWMHALLTDGAEINTPDYSGRCPLVYAAESGNIDLVRLLVDSGADVNASPVHVPGETALLVAAELGHETIVRLLLEHNATVHGMPNICLDGKKGWTALHLAAKEGHAAIVQLLVEKGAQVDAVTGDDEPATPSMCAAKAGKESVVELLSQASTV